MSEWTQQRALQALTAAGVAQHEAARILVVLQQAGFALADASQQEMVCRWVSIEERAVPPDADTIIRTITTTNNEGSRSTTHWLAGLRSPR